MAVFKEVHFKLKEWEWTQLYQIFPAMGERTAFFRQCALEAIRMGKGKRFVAQLKQRIEEEKGEPR